MSWRISHQWLRTFMNFIGLTGRDSEPIWRAV